jgi:hypothetical protein
MDMWIAAVSLFQGWLFLWISLSLFVWSFFSIYLYPRMVLIVRVFPIGVFHPYLAAIVPTRHSDCHGHL